jgi:alpha-1,6-mannosyltransferase
MRIAHVANFYGPRSGGLRTTMHHLGSGYRARGHEVLLVVPGPADLDEETAYGRRVTLRSPRLPFSGGYRVIVRPRRVRTMLDRWGPDRLEVSDRTTLRGLGRWASRRGVEAVFFNHERADGVLRSLLPRWLRRVAPVRALADAHNRGTARGFPIIACTTAYAAEEFDRIGRASIRVPLGVDLDVFGPERLNPAARARYCAPEEALLVMASRLSREKNPVAAIEAVRRLVSDGYAVRLVCAGSGPIATDVERAAEGLPIAFLGFVSDRAEFATLLACADVVIAPGPIETFGLAALEALASGTPVVVHASSALPEVVGDAGVAVEGTAEGFARGVEEVLRRHPRRRRLAARARAECFPWDATVDALLAGEGAGARRAR